MGKQINIGLFGLGCVGQGLYDVVSKSGDDTIVIKKIAVKHREKERKVPAHLIVFDKEKILNDPTIDIIVEVIDDAVEAFEIVKEALEKKKPVVTANKKMLALHLAEIIWLQEKHQTPVLYEASVCGSIPVIQTVEKYFAKENISELRGIFNGTTNYILSKIFNERLNYSSALKQAQDLGFAESDPTNDVAAFDPKYKLIILARHAYGVTIHPDDVLNIGIETLSVSDVNYAKDRNLKIKLVPELYYENNKLVTYVLPRFVNREELFYHVENENNALSIVTPFAGAQSYTGPGAGAFPTGSAVWKNIYDIVDGYKYLYAKTEAGKKTEVSDDVLLEVYLRYDSEELVSKFKFEKISEKFFDENFSYVTGYIRLAELKKLKESILKSKSIIIATGKVKFVKPKSELITSEALGVAI